MVKMIILNMVIFMFVYFMGVLIGRKSVLMDIEDAEEEQIE